MNRLTEVIVLISCIFLASCPSVAGSSDILRSGSAYPCSESQESLIKVTGFSLEYNKQTSMAEYVASFDSLVEGGVSVIMTINAYGTEVLNQLINFCNAEITELCPVKKGSFTMTGAYFVPEEYTKDMISLTYTVPDLDMLTRISISNSTTQEPLGCFETSINNGITLEGPTVMATTLAIALAVILVAAVVSVSSSASSSGGGAASGGAVGGFQAPAFTDFLGSIQLVAQTGMFSLNYPTVYQSFSSNMGWSMGAISWSGLQRQIDRFRERTGGNLNQSSYDLLQDTTLVYNATKVPSFLANSTTSLSRRMLSQKIDFLSPRDDGTLSANNTSVDVVSNTANTAARGIKSHVSKVHGIKAFVEKLSLPDTNMFLTCLVWFSIIVGLVIAIVLIIKIALEVKSLMNSSRDDKKDGLSPFWENFRRQYWVFMTTNVVRLFWIFYGVGTLYCLYQFKLNDSWAIKAIAGVTFGVFTMILLAATAKIFWLALHASHKKGGLEHLFSHQPWTAKYGLFYDCFQLKYWWFFVLFMSASFGRSAFLALGYGNGLLQVIGQLVIDLIFLVILLILKPFNTKMGNGINIAIAIVRVVSCCFLLAFTVELKVNSIKTTVVGMVLMIIQSVLMVVLAVLIMANAIWLLYRMVRNTSIVVVPKEEQDKGSINISQMGNLDEREYENEKSLCIEKDAISFLSMSQNSISTSDPIVFGQAHSTGRQFEGGHNYSHRIFTESTSHNDTKSLSSVETLPMAPYTISRKYPSSQSLVAHSFASTNPWPDNIDHGLNTIRVVGVNNNSTISLSSTSRDSISQTARNLDSAETEAKSTSRPRLIQSLSLYSVNSSLREPLYQPKFIEDWDGQPHNQDPADEADSGLAAETAK